jgi:hypothetical protein
MQQSPIEAVPGIEYKGRQYRDAAAVRAAIAAEKQAALRQLAERDRLNLEDERRRGEQLARQQWEAKLSALRSAVAGARQAALEAEQQVVYAIGTSDIAGRLQDAHQAALRAIAAERVMGTAEALVAEHLAREPRQPEG